jgi:biopolymer transport protein ExbB
MAIAVPLLLQSMAVWGAPEPASAEEEVQPVVAMELPEGETSGRTLRDWYGMGGWIMHLLVGCSVVSFTLVLERAWSLRRSAVIPRKFVLSLCAMSDTAIARVLRAGLIHFGEGLTRVEDAVETSGSHEHTLLRRNLSLLSALGNIATMLGLLGTVLGMIESFDLIAKTGTGDARVVAGGIFQALVTTAAGLMVGIFAIAAYSYFRRKVEILVIDLEDISFRLLEALYEPEESQSKAEQTGEFAPAEA